MPGINKVWRSYGCISLPLIGRAGSWREWMLMVPVSLYAVYGTADALLAGVRGWLV